MQRFGKILRMSSGHFRPMSDELWAEIRPALPERGDVQDRASGERAAEDRKCMDGILHVLRTSRPWDDLDATGICSASRAHARYQEWVSAGVFRKLREAGLRGYDALQGIDWPT